MLLACVSVARSSTAAVYARRARYRLPGRTSPVS
jgi:hypothetical protein